MRLLLVLFSAIEMAADLIGLAVNPTLLPTEAKTWILTAVVGLTILWGIGGLIVAFHNPWGWNQARRGHAVYWTTLSLFFAGAVIVLLWVTMGLPFLALVILVEVFLLAVTASDAVSAWLLLR